MHSSYDACSTHCERILGYFSETHRKYAGIPIVQTDETTVTAAVVMSNWIRDDDDKDEESEGVVQERSEVHGWRLN